MNLKVNRKYPIYRRETGRESGGSGAGGDDIRESGTHLEFQEERRKMGKVFEGKTMETS